VALSLAASPALLVLDGCETATAPLCALADQWARAAPRLTMLCTSRRPLRAPDETVVAVAGLDPEPAERFFMSRFGASAEAAVVREICLRLEGLPLAIILAASWGGVLTASEVLDRVDGGLGASPRRQNRLTDRHRTLAATLAWSHDLLGSDARIVLRRLAVLEGPAPRAFVDAVARDGDLSVLALDGALSELREAAMVTVADAGAQTRVELRGPARAYASNRLEEAGEADTTMSRLVDVVLARMADGARRASGPHQGDALGAMEEAVPLALTVLRRLADTADPRLVGLCRSMSVLWLARGQWGEARRWFRAAVPVAVTPTERAIALTGFVMSHGTFAGVASRGREARQALDLARQTGDADLLVEALLLFGICVGWSHELPTAAAAFDEACEIARATGRPVAEARASAMRGLAMALSGDARGSRLIQRRCARRLLELGDRVGAARTLLYAGHVGRLVGDEAGAERDFRRSAGVAGEVGAVSLLTHARFGSAQVVQSLGDAGARALVEQAREAFERLGDERCAAVARYSIARLTADPGRRDALLRSTLDPLARNDVMALALPLAGLAASYLERGELAEAGLLLAYARRQSSVPGLPLPRADHDFLSECCCMLAEKVPGELARRLATAGAQLTTDDVVSLAHGEASASDLMGVRPERD
jgi:predicted ATPase